MAKRLPRRLQLPFLVLLSVVGLALIVAGVARLVFVLTVVGSEAADREASVLGFLVASGGAAIAVTGFLIRQLLTRRHLPTSEQVKSAVMTLAGLARERWSGEALVRTLEDSKPMPVRWHVADPALMDHLSTITAYPELRFEGRADEIAVLAAQFRALRRQRLVIVGGYGMGKTTLAAQLLLELLPKQGADLTEPVPLLFPLSSWDEARFPNLDGWIIDQLRAWYPGVGEVDVLQSILRQGYILPVLDGLDEVPREDRKKIIAALNDGMAGLGFILTSREEEYRAAVVDAGDVVTAAAVIIPDYLTSAEASAYLRAHIPPAFSAGWDGVLDALTDGSLPNLATVSSFPLGLWLLRRVYVDGLRPPLDLIQAAAMPTDSLFTHLLEELVPSVLETRRPAEGGSKSPFRARRDYEADSFRRWLATIARQCTMTGSHEWEWWAAGQHAIPDIRLTPTVIRTFAASMVAFVLTWTVNGIFGGLISASIMILLSGLNKMFPRPQPSRAKMSLRGECRELFFYLVRVFLGFIYLGLIVVVLRLLVKFLTYWVLDFTTDAMLPFGQVYESFIDYVYREYVSASVWGILGQLVLVVAPGAVFFWTLMVLIALFGERSGSLTPRQSIRLDRNAMGCQMFSCAFVFGGLYAVVAYKAFSTRQALLEVAAGRSDFSWWQEEPGWVRDLREAILGPVTAVLNVLVSPGFLVGFLLVTCFGLGMLGRPWPGFRIVSTWMAYRKRLPWRLISFLEDAQRLGILRSSGSAYQFRHAILQDHFAASSHN